MTNMPGVAAGIAMSFQVLVTASVLLQVGMKVLEEDGRVLACYENMSDTIFHAEVGASAAIMGQGYTIDSLMLRYQGIDWRNHSSWDCNAG